MSIIELHITSKTKCANVSISSRRSRLRLAILSLAAVTAITFAHLRTNPELPQTVELKGGFALSLIAVTYGTNHVAPNYSWWKMLPHLPKALTGDINDFKIVSTDTSIGLWFRIQSAFRDEPQRIMVVTCLDEQNVEVVVGRFRQSALKPSTEIVGTVLPIFPRELKTLRIRVYARDAESFKAVRMASFEFSNPGRLRDTLWSSDRSLTNALLEGLQVGVSQCIVGSSPKGLSVTGFGDYPWLMGRIVLDLRENLEMTTNWFVPQLDIMDSTGNSITNPIYSTLTLNNGDIAINYYPALWPHSIPWKLRIQFVRTRYADFSREEMHNIGAVPISTSTPGNSVWQTNLFGTLLEFKLLITDWSTNSIPKGQDAFFVGKLTVTPVLPVEGLNVTILAISNNILGRIAIEPNDVSNGNEATFKFPPGITNISVDLASHKTRYGEFYVKPEINWHSTLQP